MKNQISTDSTQETLEHIRKVNKYLSNVAVCLIVRAVDHDNSKLHSPEKEGFDKFNYRLKNVTYGSDEYKGLLEELKPVLEHHYRLNRHHPEHYKDGIKGMNLLDLIEMMMDWKAATERHNDGDIFKSIEINQKRFGYSDELKQIFINTIKEIFIV